MKISNAPDVTTMRLVVAQKRAKTTAAATLPKTVPGLWTLTTLVATLVEIAAMTTAVAAVAVTVAQWWKR